MRSPRHDLAANSTELDPLPSLGVLVMNRMAFGPRPGDLSRFESLGATDRERLEKYVEAQLYPEKISDTDLEYRLLNAGFSTLNKSRAQLWADHADNPRGDRYLPLWETERATISRAMYSERELLDGLADV